MSLVYVQDDIIDRKDNDLVQYKLRLGMTTLGHHAVLSLVFSCDSLTSKVRDAFDVVALVPCENRIEMDYFICA